MTPRLLVITALIAAAFAPPVFADPPYELTVKAHHAIGASRGTLVFNQDGIEYRTDDRGNARRWTYDEIQQLQLLGPQRVKLLTFEEQGFWRFGRTRILTFEVVDGAVSAELSSFLLTHVDRPIVSAVAPSDCRCSAVARIPVRHAARKGSDGMLIVYRESLAYVSERPEESRYWRYADVAGVLRLDPYRLLVTAYEGGAGQTRPFVFDLKRTLPDEVYAMVWASVNPPARLGGAANREFAGAAPSGDRR